MPDYVQNTINTFVGGLITEAGALTFPQNASIDELNCDIFKDGSRRRRLGMVVEASGEYTTETVSTTNVVSTHLWKNVAEQQDTTFVVVQAGSQLIFFADGDNPLSANRVPTSDSDSSDYVLSLTTFQKAGGNAATERVEVASVKGALVVASPAINTFYITRDTDDNSFTATEVAFKIRDYKWLGDTTTYDVKIGDADGISEERKYDTWNAGWAGNPIQKWRSNQGSAGNPKGYPPLNTPWYSGKNADGDLSNANIAKVGAGNSLITNGHYVYDLYTMNRSGTTNFSVENSPESSRFSTVASYAGRVFYSGMLNSSADNGSRVFFSRILEIGFSEIGNCYQRNDPTAETLNDLLDTDGGYISIPEAHNIRKLHVFGPNLFVFADNGVWQIGGIDDVFRASEYTVSKLSEDGIISSASFVSGQGRPYWWSATGIFTLQANQVGEPRATNMTQTTIQTFFDNISPTMRSNVSGAYDETQQRVLWLYPDNDATNLNKRNKILIFDEQLTAFVPWTVSDMSASTDYIVDAVFSRGVGSVTTTDTVVTNGGDTVQTNGGDDVTTILTNRTLASSRIKFLVVDGTNDNLTFGGFTSIDFLDWDEGDYSSYAEAAYDFLGDLEMRKTAPYVTTYMKRTETGWESNGSAYDLLRPSSLKLSAYWNFRNQPSTTPQEMYRLKYAMAVDTGDLTTVDYPNDTIISRLKVRGRGRVMRLRFDATTGHDFHLLGWGVAGQRTGRL